MRPTKPKRELLSETELLQAAFQFTDADLELNRQGNLSEWQSKLLRDKRMKGIGKGLKTATQAFIAAMLAFACMFTCGFSRLSNISFAPGLVFIALILFVVLGTYQDTKKAWQKPNIDLQEQKVVSVQGLAILDIMEKPAPTYRLTIGGLIFEIDKAAFSAFKNRDLYNVYYTPHSFTLLSAEPLSQTFKSPPEEATR